MGGFDDKGNMTQCIGDDVLSKLNDVFGNPGTPAFEAAWAAREEFKNVGTGEGNYRLLIAAYKAAGVDVKTIGNWEAYLRLLGSVKPQGPSNINAIAELP